MSEEAKIDQELDRWQEIFDAMIDWVLLISSDFRILRVNRVFRNYFGLTNDEIIGVKSHKLIHGLDAPIEGCPCARSLVSTIHEESEIIDHGRSYAVTASPMFEDGKIFAFVSTYKDITDQKEQERLKAVLETAGAVCHNLAQPMQVVTANIDLLTMNTRDLPEEVKDKLSTILDHVGRMGKLLKQFQNIRLSPTVQYDENTNMLDIDKAIPAADERIAESRDSE